MFNEPEKDTEVGFQRIKYSKIGLCGQSVAVKDLTKSWGTSGFLHRNCVYFDCDQLFSYKSTQQPTQWVGEMMVTLVILDIHKWSLKSTLTPPGPRVFRLFIGVHDLKKQKNIWILWWHLCAFWPMQRGSYSTKVYNNVSGKHYIDKRDSLTIPRAFYDSFTNLNSA